LGSPGQNEGLDRAGLSSFKRPRFMRNEFIMDEAFEVSPEEAAREDAAIQGEEPADSIDLQDEKMMD